MHGPIETDLQEEWIDAAAMVADDNGTFFGTGGHPLRKLGALQQPNEEQSDDPEQALRKRQPASRERDACADERRSKTCQQKQDRKRFVRHRKFYARDVPSPPIA